MNSADAGQARATEVFRRFRMLSRHGKERLRRSNPALLCCSGLLRGACHRARIRATGGSQRRTQQFERSGNRLSISPTPAVPGRAPPTFQKWVSKVGKW